MSLPGGTQDGQQTFGLEDLTVNICTVDRPDYLQACLASLLDTTPEGVPLQILFNSTPAATRERTIAQAESWNGPTRFVHIEDIVPVDESHNRALAGIETPLVNFMGDDDVVLGNRLPAMVDAFNSLDPQPAVVTTFARRVAGDPFEPSIGSNKDLGPTNVSDWKAWHDSGQAFELLWPGAVLRTGLLREIGGFEAPFSQSFDNRIFSQMSFLGPVISLPTRDFGFRIHQGSMSSTNWKAQNEIVRFVAASHLARIEGRTEPTYDDFVTAEAADPIQVRVRRQLRDRSRIHFRKGGELALSGRRAKGAANIAASMLFWPPAFVEKVSDQIGNRSSQTAPTS